MKILLLRFSSFGDVLQTLSVAGKLSEKFPQAEIHWVTRSEFSPLIETHPHVKRVWSLNKGAGYLELRRLGRRLGQENFTHIYDAHNNLRSHLLTAQLNGFLGWRVWFGGRRFLRRSIYRWRRFLLFNFHYNLFPKPFTGQFALLEPLSKWGIDAVPPQPPQLFLPSARVKARLASLAFRDFVALAPSASYQLKRWPIEHWRQLIRLMPGARFVVLGGPEDVFLQELVDVAPERVLNLAGQLSLFESADVVAGARALVSNDTGLLHVAEQIGKPCLALMGPAPFGYPGRASTQVFEKDLACRPCSKHGQGPCVNQEYQKCLRDIEPESVAVALRRLLDASMDASLPQS